MRSEIDGCGHHAPTQLRRCSSNTVARGSTDLDLMRLRLSPTAARRSCAYADGATVWERRRRAAPRHARSRNAHRLRPMLDPDISTADALAHLQVAETDRTHSTAAVSSNWSGSASVPGHSSPDRPVRCSISSLPGLDPSAWAAGPAGPNDGILIVIGMFGGNDGLNTVVPINDGSYYGQHGSLAIRPENTLPLDAATRAQPGTHRVQAVLGRRSARDRRRGRLPRPRPQPLQLDGEMDGGPTARAPHVGMDRPMARRIPRRWQGPLRRRRDRPLGAAAPDRASAARHRRAGRPAVVRCVGARPTTARSTQRCGAMASGDPSTWHGQDRPGDDRPARPRRRPSHR